MFYRLSETLRQYYYLIKPGIVFNNALTAAAGFLFVASQQIAQPITGIAVVIGTGLVIASACVFNNVIDRRIDHRMERTKRRALVTGRVSIRGALLFGAILGIIGFTLLITMTNLTTTLIGVIAYLWYIAIYGYAKRRTEHGTLIGTVPGALPPVAGYTAVAGTVDLAAVILFFMLVFWQMAHFYAIAIYRKNEYAAARIPIITVKRGTRPAVIQIIVYSLGFLLVSLLLVMMGYMGASYAIVMFAIGGFWFLESLRLLPLKGRGLEKAARSFFKFSLIVNLVMCVAIALGGYIP